jgi:hypothetical protein
MVSQDLRYGALFVPRARKSKRIGPVIPFDHEHDCEYQNDQKHHDRPKNSSHFLILFLCGGIVPEDLKRNG